MLRYSGTEPLLRVMIEGQHQNEIRGWARETLPTYQDRKAFFEAIVNGSPDPIDLLRKGDGQAARDLIAAHVRAVETAGAPA